MWLDDFVTAASSQLDDRALEALYARGVTDKQIATYRMGYIDKALPALDYPPNFMSWSFHGEKLDDSFVLPLTNALGEVKGIQFRHVEQEKRGYTEFIAERGEAVLFGLGQAAPLIWTTRRILLVEGAFDLFPLQRYFPGIVATLTAHLLDALVRVLRRMDVGELWLAYDRDKTGRESTEKVTKTYSREFKIHTLSVPGDVKTVDGKTVKDPSGLWEAWGETRFGGFIRPLIERSASMESF
jgi:DNA primase